MFLQGIKRKINLIFFLLLLIAGVASVRMEGAESRSGILRGGFAVDEAGNSRVQPESNQQTVNRNSGGTAQSSGQQNPQAGNTDNRNQGVIQGGVPVEGNSRSNPQQTAGRSQAANSQSASANPETGNKKKNRADDDVDYKKIYFLIISALILFLYLIFGLKRRGRRRGSNSRANRYYR